jgi:hypothetical protein
MASEVVDSFLVISQKQDSYHKVSNFFLITISAHGKI